VILKPLLKCDLFKISVFSPRVRSLIWLLLLHRSIFGNAPCPLIEAVSLVAMPKALVGLSARYEGKPNRNQIQNGTVTRRWHWNSGRMQTKTWAWRQVRKILRERSRNPNREVWESPSVLRRRGCQYSPIKILSLSSTNARVSEDTVPHRFSSRSTEIDLTSSHLIKLGIFTPPSGGSTFM